MAKLNVKSALKVLDNLPKEQAVLVDGPHGIGKSTIFRDLAKKRNAHFIDMRLSQVEYVDLIGMPQSVNGEMIYSSPWWRREIEACAERGQNVVLLLDEINRAHRDVLQSVFQLILDRRIQDWALPSNVDVWVYGAVNMGDDYDVSMMDPALLDRFYRFTLEPSPAEWLRWSKSVGIHRAIHMFIEKNHNYLYFTGTPEEGRIYPSPRSWAMLSNCMNLNKKLVDDHHALTLLSMGFVGEEGATRFVDFVKKEFNQMTAKDILEKWKDRGQDITELVTDDVVEASTLMDQCIEFFRAKGEDGVKPRHIKNFTEYMLIVPLDVINYAWQALQEYTEDGGDVKNINFVASKLGDDERIRTRVVEANSEWIREEQEKVKKGAEGE